MHFSSSSSRIPFFLSLQRTKAGFVFLNSRLTWPSSVVTMPSGGLATSPSWSTATPGPHEESEHAGRGAASLEAVSATTYNKKIYMNHNLKVNYKCVRYTIDIHVMSLVSLLIYKNLIVKN